MALFEMTLPPLLDYTAEENDLKYFDLHIFYVSFTKNLLWLFK